MILALVRQTREQVRAIRLADLVDYGPLKAKARLLALVAAPVLALAAWDPGFPGRTLALVVHPLEHLPPADVFIHVATGDVRVVRGSPVAVEAATSGAQPDRVVLEFRPSATGDGGEAAQTIDMDRTRPDRYAALLPEVTEDLDYRVAAGPFASPWYRIAATERPSVTDLDVTLYPPHYTGLPDETLAGGNVRGVKGSTLRFAAAANKPLAHAVLVLDDGREVPLKVTGDRVRGGMVLFRSQRYRIRIEDPFGFENLPIPYEMHAVPDGFPVVELLEPAEDLEVNGDERLALEYRADDDYGVREVVLVARVGDREERLPVWRREPARTVRDRFVWDLDAMRLDAGDVVTYHLEILDNDTISGPKLGKVAAVQPPAQGPGGRAPTGHGDDPRPVGQDGGPAGGPPRKRSGRSSSGRGGTAPRATVGRGARPDDGARGRGDGARPQRPDERLRHLVRPGDPEAQPRIRPDRVARRRAPGVVRRGAGAGPRRDGHGPGAHVHAQRGDEPAARRPGDGVQRQGHDQGPGALPRFAGKAQERPQGARRGPGRAVAVVQATPGAPGVAHAVRKGPPQRVPQPGEHAEHALRRHALGHGRDPQEARGGGHPGRDAVGAGVVQPDGAVGRLPPKRAAAGPDVHDGADAGSHEPVRQRAAADPPGTAGHPAGNRGHPRGEHAGTGGEAPGSAGTAGGEDPVPVGIVDPPPRPTTVSGTRRGCPRPRTRTP